MNKHYFAGCNYRFMYNKLTQPFSKWFSIAVTNDKAGGKATKRKDDNNNNNGKIGVNEHLLAPEH
jgi:hypothetical protein